MDKSKVSDFNKNSYQESVLHEDKHVIITNNEIIIKCYYFPFAGEKKISFKQIKKIELINIGSLTGKLKVWGMNYKLLWFHFDAGRLFKNHGIVIDIGKYIKPAITPEDINKVFHILQGKIFLKIEL